MSAIFVRPLSFVAIEGNAHAQFPLMNLNDDRPGLTWRSPGSGWQTIRIDLGENPASHDTVAIIGSNQTSADKWYVAYSHDGSTLIDASGWIDIGARDEVMTSKSVYLRASALAARYVHITLAGDVSYWEIQRIVIGKAIKTDGVDQNAEQSFDDPSPSIQFPGGAIFDEYPVISTWKVRMSWIPDEQWRSEWLPFLTRVGNKKPILFVPRIDHPERFQGEVTFGRIMSSPKGQHRSFDDWLVELTITALAP